MRFLYLAAIGWSLAACDQASPPPKLHLKPLSVPDRRAKNPAAAWEPDAGVAALPASSPAELLRPALRFARPGAVRFNLDIEEPVSFIRPTPLAGLIVSAGPAVYNVTSRGEVRFRHVAGEGHRLFSIGETEIVWTPSSSQLRSLKRRGKIGWSRDIANGSIVSDSKGEIYLLDASTVALIGQDGRDRWRATPAEVQRLEGPFDCGGGALFYGLHGMQRKALLISQRGAVSAETQLARGAVLLGAGPACQPLVWLDGQLELQDARGRPIWRHATPVLPSVQRLKNGFALFISTKSGANSFVVLEDSGRVVLSSSLPASGTITATNLLFEETAFRLLAVGLCIDVNSPCSRQKGNRGPWNTLLVPSGDNSFRSMIRHVQGHLGFAYHPSGGYVVASSSGENNTDLTLRDQNQQIVWQTALPGRLTAGPSVGTSGEIYVGTCAGWDCREQRRLVAVTGVVEDANKPAAPAIHPE